MAVPNCSVPFWSLVRTGRQPPPSGPRHRSCRPIDWRSRPRSAGRHVPRGGRLPVVRQPPRVRRAGQGRGTGGWAAYRARRGGRPRLGPAMAPRLATPLRRRPRTPSPRSTGSRKSCPASPSTASTSEPGSAGNANTASGRTGSPNSANARERLGHVGVPPCPARSRPRQAAKSVPSSGAGRRSPRGSNVKARTGGRPVRASKRSSSRESPSPYPSNSAYECRTPGRGAGNWRRSNAPPSSNSAWTGRCDDSAAGCGQVVPILSAPARKAWRGPFRA